MSRTLGAIAVIFLSIFLKIFMLPRCLPFGPALPLADILQYSQVDYSLPPLNKKNKILKKIYERPDPQKRSKTLLSPETIVVDDWDNIYALSPKTGSILSLTDITPSPQDANVLYATVTVVANVKGVPLGAKFVPGTKTLYFADAMLGLCRIDLSKKHPKIELVASRVKVSNGDMGQDDSWSPILYADDVDIGEESGMVYFSDASDISPEDLPKIDEHGTGKLSYDFTHGYKLDLLRGVKTGRLLRYNPVTDEVNVLASNVWFANGVAVNEREGFVVLSESSMARVLKYHLKGEKSGTIEILLNRLMGFPDGCDCVTGGSSVDLNKKCYVAIPSPIIPIVQVIYSPRMPTIISTIIRTLIMTIPSSMSPKPGKYAAIVEFTPDNGDITRIFQDPHGEEVQMVTGVTAKNGKLYLGSLHEDFVGVLDLDE